LMILEKLLRVRVDVYLQTRDVKDSGQEPLLYIAMNLQFEHYESVVHNKHDVFRTAWSKSEIPDFNRIFVWTMSGLALLQPHSCRLLLFPTRFYFITRRAHKWILQ
jgi:hypothetical protein